MRSTVTVLIGCLVITSLPTGAFVPPSCSLRTLKNARVTERVRTSSRARVVLKALSTLTSELSDSTFIESTPLESTFIESTPRESWIGSLSGRYSQLTKDHYLLMAFLQAGFLASGADLTTQTLEGASPIDVSHLAAMATVASTMSGCMNAVCLRQLENAFPGTDTKEVASKTVIHAILVANIINSVYLIGVPLLTECYGKGVFPTDPSLILGGWKLEEFVTLTKLEVLMFIPYNTLAFKYIPPQVRPLTSATVSALFNVAISAVTLGYFNVWCERISAFTSSL